MNATSQSKISAPSGSPTLYLTTAPHVKATALVTGRRVLTPNPRAARALGVAARSLQREAQLALAGSGLVSVDALTAARLMQDLAQQQGYRDPAGTARSMAPVVSEVLRSGVDVDQLAKFDDPRVQRVASFARGYLTLLRRAKLHDPAETYWLAALCLKTNQQVLLYGYQRLGRDEEAFLGALAGPGSAVVLPHGDHDAYAENLELAQRFAQAGWTIERVASDQVQRPTKIEGWVFADQEDEVRGVLAHVKELLLQGVSPRDVVLAARDDAEYGPLVLAIARELGIPLRAEYRIPLRETRLGHWVGLLAEVLEGDLPFEKTYRLLGHPLCQTLDGAQRLEARKTHPVGDKAWTALGAPVAALDWPDRATRSEWTERLASTLHTLQVVRRARRWACEAIAVGRLKAALKLVASHDPAPISRSEFLAELHDVLALQTTPAAPGRGGVGLHTPLAMYGAQVQHLFVLGAAEDQLPARLSDDPVLDYSTRKRLAEQGFGLETATGAARRERLTFDSLLLVASQTLTLAHPRLQGKKPSLPSPAYGWLGITSIQTPEVPVASPEMGRRIKILGAPDPLDPVLGRAQQALEVERRREAPGSLTDADTHDGTSGVAVDWRKRTFSSSQLTALGQCGFKWWAQQILKLKEPDEAVEEVLPNVRGQLYHKTLELACEAAKGQPNVRQTVLAALEASMRQAEIDLASELHIQLATLPGWEARREEYLTVLRNAVAHDGFLDPGAGIESLERAFEGAWRGFPLRGRVDRIDRVGEELVILDYKAGSSNYGLAQDADRKNTVDLQLPIYLETAAPNLYPGEPVREASYYYLSKPKRQPAKPDDALLDALARRLQAMLDAGSFRVAPDIGGGACTYCDHDLVCRTGTRLGRKEV